MAGIKSRRGQMRKGLKSEWLKRLRVAEQQIHAVMLDMIEEGWSLEEDRAELVTATFDDGQLYANLHTARQILQDEMPAPVGSDPKPVRVTKKGDDDGNET